MPRPHAHTVERDRLTAALRIRSPRPVGEFRQGILIDIFGSHSASANRLQSAERACVCMPHYAARAHDFPYKTIKREHPL
jgi:hypothetical protein